MAAPDECTLMKIADAVAAEIPTLFPEVGIHECTVTFYKRFDAEKTPGLNVYVYAREDQPAPTEQGGDRDHDPNFHRLTIAVCERIPAELETFAERDVHVRGRVNFVGGLHDRFDSRIPVVVDDLKYTPIETGPREACDLDLLNEQGVFESQFDVTIREE